MKNQILESMKILVSEGQTIASGNNNDFSEFAYENRYDLKLVEEVYAENEEKLTEIWKKANENL
ncbi:MAG TPA: hypothetical protein VK982_06235 [Bacteroidales bacterium]|nr:hypothetical protein [Bacteroidales bacterium]